MGKATAPRAAKAAKAKAKPLNARLRGFIATAAAVGYGVRDSFQAGVTLAKQIGGNNRTALIEAGLEYKAGYIVRSLEAVPAYAKRWGNMDRNLRLEEARAIMAQPTPESTKPNRRTEVAHKAVRSADTSWSTCKRLAGIVAERKGGRKPRPAAKATAKGKVVPISLAKASPKLANREAANDYFRNVAAALLATVDKNAAIMPPQLSSAVSDFKAAVTKFVGK